ncbi:MAG: helicase, partial [Bradyrhizobium sp.]
ALHPRLRIISDERLTGASREAVQTRLDLWLKTHIEKLLGPLFELSKAEDLQGIARGIAFQLVEALGVLERTKIAAEMKDLDQPSRAALRKYGVRFGAYHIYFPQLLKPAARSLASLLWAEKQSNVDMAALSNVQHLASSGRTSFPVDKALPRDGYRVLGYRQCGERAVRVDILERLADLIRPALAWRETSPGEKPAGAFDGRGFVVTQAMTSLTGSAGEDFASILRALGYRMDRRPPLPPKPVAATPVAATETVAAETTEAPAADASVEAGSDAAVDAPAEAAAELTADAPEAATDQVVSGDPAPSAALLPDVGFAEVVASEATPVVIETRPEPEPVAEVAAEPAALAEQPVAEVPASEAAPAVEAAAEAPSGAT